MTPQEALIHMCRMADTITPEEIRETCTKAGLTFNSKGQPFWSREDDSSDICRRPIPGGGDDSGIKRNPC